MKYADAGLWYMASPLTSPDPAIYRDRLICAARAKAEFLRAGLLAYSPVCETVPVVEYAKWGDHWDDWSAVDEAMISNCDGLLVLMLPGWKESVGVNAEIELAERFGLPVHFVDPAKIGETILQVTRGVT